MRRWRASSCHSATAPSPLGLRRSICLKEELSFFFFFKKKKDIKETNVSLFVERLRIGAQQSQQRAAGCMKARVCLERALSSTIRHGDIQLPISSFSLSEVHVQLCGVAVCVCLFSINSLLLGCLQVCNYSLELTDSG